MGKNDMDKNDEIIEIIQKLSEYPEKKKKLVMEQKYEAGAELRDEERMLLSKLDEVSGVKDFYRKVYDGEKILQHLEILVNSTEQLKKLRPKFGEVFEDMSFEKYLVKLYKQRDEAYDSVLQIRSLIK